MTQVHDREGWLSVTASTCPASTMQHGAPLRIVLLGAPGVGKGTQADQLSQLSGTCHLSTGDVFRMATLAACDCVSPSIREALAYMQRGELVPDATVIAILRERMQCLRCMGGFILDGFPRTVPQAQSLDKLLQEAGVKLDAVISYDMPIEQIVPRLAGRRTCSTCKAVYHVTANPPPSERQCRCGGELYQREDDRPGAICRRMEQYQESTAPLMAYYSAQGLLVSIMADGSPGDILRRTLSRLSAAIPVGLPVAPND